MNRKFAILEREGLKFKEIGKIVEKNGKVFLVGFNKEDEKFFMERIGIGEKHYTPEDGSEYVDAVVDEFMFSSSIVVKLLED